MKLPIICELFKLFSSSIKIIRSLQLTHFEKILLYHLSENKIIQRRIQLILQVVLIIITVIIGA